MTEQTKAGALPTPHEELRKTWAPGQQWEYRVPHQSNTWFPIYGEPDWDEDWEFRLAQDQTAALYADAVNFAKEKASISYVQRKCRCSYNDAERMLERMVSEGILITYNCRKVAAPVETLRVQPAGDATPAAQGSAAELTAPTASEASFDDGFNPIEGQSYQSKGHGTVRFRTMDFERGEPIYHFETARGIRYMKRERMLDDIQRPAAVQQSTPATDCSPAMEAVIYAEAMLTNLQPHIPQSCYPGRDRFIDNYVNPVLEKLRSILPEHHGRKTP